MKCVACQKLFDQNQGRFIQGEKLAGWSGKVYDFYCKDCNPKVPIDARSQTPEPQVPPARVGEPPKRELPPVESYEDEGTPFNDPIPF